MDQDALSPTQRQALDQLQALTNGGDVDVAISMLESVGWDVQVSFSFLSHSSECDTGLSCILPRLSIVVVVTIIIRGNWSVAGIVVIAHAACVRDDIGSA